MPVQIIVTEGLLTASAEKEVFKAVTDTFLKLHDLTGNAFMTPNIIGEITVVPKGRTFSGGTPTDIAIVEVKSPSFAFGTTEQKKVFVAEVTEVVLKAAGGKLAKEQIYVNLVYAVDGMWGIGGKAYTNECLLSAVKGENDTCCASKGTCC